MPTRNFKLPIEAKRHIVRALALKTSHADIVNQVQEQFGIIIHIRALAHYTVHNERLDPELKAIYEDAKAQHWREIEEESARWWEKRKREKQLEEEARRAAMKAQMEARLSGK